MTNASPVRVLIADDHLLFAESLGLTLDIDDRLEHVGTARNGKEAVRMVEELRPNVVLMDLDMPVMDGIEATRELQRSFPDCQVVVLTASLAVEDAHRARSAGAAAYLTKGCIMRDVIDALPGGCSVISPAKGGKRLACADCGRLGRRGVRSPSCNRERFQHTEC